MVVRKSQQELIDAINELVKEDALLTPNSYNTQQAYQSYERIGYEGMRWSVEKRIAEYGLERLYAKAKQVLDIGSNFGFFTVESALRSGLAHGIEPNPFLIEIGIRTADHLGVSEQVEFFDCTFDQFINTIQYDLVLSLAAFHTGDGRERSNADDYFSKVNHLLNDEGRLFFESCSYVKDAALAQNDSAITNQYAKERAMEAIGRQLVLEEEWETVSGSPGYFRFFAIARKRQD